MVGADLQGLVTAHDQTGLLVLLVLQQTHITSTTLLPLLAVTVELEKLGAHLEGLLLQLLVGLGLNLLGEANDGLEVDIDVLGGFLLLNKQRIVVSQTRTEKNDWEGFHEMQGGNLAANHAKRGAMI